MLSESFLPILRALINARARTLAIKLTQEAEVTTTWLAPRTMMITSKLLTSIRSTTCSTKRLRPVAVQLLVVAFEFLFELLLQLIALADSAVAPT
jgi:hypothetical protein